MSSSQIAQLKRAVEDARMLVDFAVTSSRRVEDNILDEVMKTTKELGDLDALQSVDLEKEAQFWKAYQALTQATHPVSAASIRQSEEAARSWWGTTATHAVVAAVIFLLWALLQATWVIGTSLRKDLDESDKAILANEEKRRPIDSQLRNYAAESNRLRENPKEPGTVKRLQEINDENTKFAAQLESIDQTLGPLRNQREPLVQLLQGWYSTTTLRLGLISSNTTILELQKDLEQFRKSDSSKTTFLSTSIARLQEIAINRRIAQARDQRVFELKQRADLLLDVLQKYAFPVLLGLLGALTYILRSLIVQIREYSYRSNFSSLSFVRICLGMMSGLLGGMLISPTDTVLKNLPPLALPFLFGYAVEVIFSFLDRIVKAFIDEKTPTK